MTNSVSHSLVWNFARHLSYHCTNLEGVQKRLCQTHSRLFVRKVAWCFSLVDNYRIPFPILTYTLTHTHTHTHTKVFISKPQGEIILMNYTNRLNTRNRHQMSDKFLFSYCCFKLYKVTMDWSPCMKFCASPELSSYQKVFWYSSFSQNQWIYLV